MRSTKYFDSQDIELSEPVSLGGHDADRISLHLSVEVVDGGYVGHKWTIGASFEDDDVSTDGVGPHEIEGLLSVQLIDLVALTLARQPWPQLDAAPRPMLRAA